jgi:pyruvate dehydrogenase E2 component (dihydrolipoamide acetyltransferase)
VTLNDFLIKAVALSLRVCLFYNITLIMLHNVQAVPAVNVQYVNETVKQIKEIDISVAVATPSGLITPIVTKADSRGLKNIAETIRVFFFHSRVLLY